MRNLILFCALAAGSFASDVGYTVEVPKNYTQLDVGEHGSVLYRVEDSRYKDKAMLIDLHGSHYEMGYDYGLLLAEKCKENYFALLGSILGTKWWTPAAEAALGVVADWQWDAFLSKQAPDEFLQEIRGMREGGKKKGVDDLDKLAKRSLVLANMPGDIGDFLIVLRDELPFSHVAPEVRDALEVLALHFKEIKTTWKTLQCSMLATWGERVEGENKIFSGRNLDWSKDTGIDKNKVIAVYHPTDGHAHVTAGFAGLTGALAGMSAAGLTVHEANLEEKAETFKGFPWLLRLRWVMEHASNISEAHDLFERSNNTVGFNHMVASAADAKLGPGSHAAMVFETAAHYTAYFSDDDDREADATFVDPKTNQTVHTGAPMADALWRTNHGYDPEIIKGYMWNLAGGAGADSLHRYWIIHDAIDAYNSSGTKIGALEAVNITSIVGSKGDDFYRCSKPFTGINVLSVTFAPSDGIMYAAFEDGTADDWTPACCNNYLEIDMKPWFARKPQ